MQFVEFLLCIFKDFCCANLNAAKAATVAEFIQASKRTFYTIVFDDRLSGKHSRCMVLHCLKVEARRGFTYILIS